MSNKDSLLDSIQEPYFPVNSNTQIIDERVAQEINKHEHMLAQNEAVDKSIKNEIENFEDNEEVLLIPTLNSELLLFATVGLTIRFKKRKGTATGFMYCKSNTTSTVLVTNKHAIYDKEELASKLMFNLHGLNAERKPIRKKIACVVNLKPEFIINHPNVRTDLCAIPVVEILNQNPHAENCYFAHELSDQFILSNDQFSQRLGAVNDVLMYGYPNGVYDHRNNFPIIRRGTTASHPGVDVAPSNKHDNKSGIVDIACWVGSSGSPIVILKEGMFFDKTIGNSTGLQYVFLGVLYAGPTITLNSTNFMIKDIPISIEEEDNENPTSSIEELSKRTNNEQTIHLGYYIKAQRLLELNNLIDKWHNKEG